MLGIPFLENAIGNWFKPQTFDDPVDRINYWVTSTLLTFFALMVSAKQYVGSPIQCWMPNEFKGGWEEYAEDYCFIQNTYYVPFDEEVPIEINARDERQFGYYQWVPVVLALQAVLFYLPNWLWKTLHQQSGIDLSTAISDARNLRALPSGERRQEMGKLVTYVNEVLEVNEPRRSTRTVFCFRFGRTLGSYVSTLYLGIKLLYLCNVFGQFVLLNSFIGRGYNMWGWTALQSLWTGAGWNDSPVFPRVSLCDFRVRRLANLHRHTVQCVLMINMFNEKIYLFIWFWFLFVAIATIINFFYCVMIMIPPSSRERSIRQWLKQVKFQEITDSKQTAPIVERFANHALRADGVLLLRFIEGHAGAIVARELCARLFSEYIHQYSTPIYNQHHLGDLTSKNLLQPNSQDSHASTKSTSPGVDDAYLSDQPYQKLLQQTPNARNIEDVHPSHQQALMEPDNGSFTLKPKHI